MHATVLFAFWAGISVCVASCGGDDGGVQAKPGAYDVKIHTPPDGFVRFHDVWAAPGGGDVLAVAEEPFDDLGREFHWHEGEWNSKRISILATSIWGHSDTLHRNVWIGGSSGSAGRRKLLQRENDSWYPRDEALLRSAGSALGFVQDVWSSAQDNVWTIAGRDALDLQSQRVFQLDGDGWQEHELFWDVIDPVSQLGDYRLESICGTSSGSTWVTTQRIIEGPDTISGVYEWNGTEWLGAGADPRCLTRDMKCDESGPWILLRCDPGFYEVRRRLEGEWHVVYTTENADESVTAPYFAAMVFGGVDDIWLAGAHREPDVPLDESSGTVWHIVNGVAFEVVSPKDSLGQFWAITRDDAGRVWAVGDLGALVEITFKPR